MKALAFCMLLATSSAWAQASYTTPHTVDTLHEPSVTLNGQAFINHGLVGTGRLSAQIIDFLGDTLGSFSSLAIAPGSWRRMDDHYEATLWTLPDRGRNDPDVGLFYDYPARLHRFKLRFTPYLGKNLPASTTSQHQVQITPDGGLELKDFNGNPFTGADPGNGTLHQHGVLLPSPHQGKGAGKISMDAESLQFTQDGHFYIGDEYAAYVYYFDAQGRLQGVITPPAAVLPRTHDQTNFNSVAAPDAGRRNNQGVEGMSLSPDGKRLFVALQSALIQDSARGDAHGRSNTRVLVYDVSDNATPTAPIAHYVMQLPTYRDKGDGKAANKTAAQSEIHALNEHQFLMLSRDGNGLGTDNEKPIVYKSVLLVDTQGATNLAGTAYETGTQSVLRSPDETTLNADIQPLRWVELVNMLNSAQLARFGMNLHTQPKNQPLTLAEKWEAMDLVPVLDPKHPNDYFLFVGNDNDFIARHCVMDGQPCDSTFDNDNMLLVYRLSLPTMQRDSSHPTE
ncbi:MAG: esterase-like activity of phytase family protein [Rhodanobacter sp.]